MKHIRKIKSKGLRAEEKKIKTFFLIKQQQQQQQKAKSVNCHEISSPCDGCLFLSNIVK